MWKGSCVSWQVHFISWWHFLHALWFLRDISWTYTYEWKVLMPNMVENWTSMYTCNGLLGVILNFWIKRHSSDHFMFIWTLLTNKLFFIFYNFYTVHIWCHVFEQINCFNLYKWWWRKKIKIKYKTDESFSRCITPQRPAALKEKLLIGQNFKLVYFLQ